MNRFIGGLLGLVLLLAAPSAVGAGSGTVTASLQGRLLVAAPSLNDPNFSHTVIYVVDHDAQGTFGLVVNRRLGSAPLDKLIERFGLPGEGLSGAVTLYAGGPMQNEIGFLLHTPDYRDQSTLDIGPGFCLSTSAQAVIAIGGGHKPQRYLFALGYAGWGPGQLEGEVARGDWLVAPADPGMIFEGDDEVKWERARRAAGITL